MPTAAKISTPATLEAFVTGFSLFVFEGTAARMPGVMKDKELLIIGIVVLVGAVFLLLVSLKSQAIISGCLGALLLYFYFRRR